MSVNSITVVFFVSVVFLVIMVDFVIAYIILEKIANYFLNRKRIRK